MSLIMSNLLIVNCTRGLRSISHYEAHSELIVATMSLIVATMSLIVSS